MIDRYRLLETGEQKPCWLTRGAGVADVVSLLYIEARRRVTNAVFAVRNRNHKIIAVVS